jgi:major vault protein
MSIENRQKIPVPRRFFLWSINESSGEVLTHVGPTEFTPSANDRIVRDKAGGGLEVLPQMEARPFVVARDGEYAVLSNPVRGETSDEMPNGIYIPGGNKEKELILGGRRVIPGPCGFPLWPGQSAEVRPAHKLGANHYLLVEVMGPIDEKAPYAKLVIASAGLSSAVIDSGEAVEGGVARDTPAPEQTGPARQLRLGQRIVIQGRHTQLFIPPTGIEVVPPVEEWDTPGAAGATAAREGDGLASLSTPVAQECTKLVAQVQAGLSSKQFSVLKNELRHRADLSSSDKAIVLTALDVAWDEKQAGAGVRAKGRLERGEGRTRSPADPYARRAVVLGPKEFCYLFDADGNARIVRGPARVFPGPYDTFMQRGSRRRSYDAFELAEHQALWLRIISPITKDKLALHLPPGFPLDREHYEAGHELIVRGLPSVFFPFIEAEVVNPSTREPHVGNDHESVIIDAIGIDQRAGIYVRDLRTGIVRLVRGETSYLVDPRFEEHLHRRVPREQWNLTVAHAEPHKACAGPEQVTTPWALSVLIPNNEAVLVSSHHRRRVEQGPKVVLLEYEESLASLRLSKGPSKDGHSTMATSFLRVSGARVADTFELESSDFVRFKVKLGFMGHFEGESERWFQVDDPVKLLADTARAKVREAARAETATRLLKELPALVRQTLFKDATPMRFVENGMVIDNVDVLHVSITDADLAQLFAQAQREAVKLQLTDEQAVRRLASARHQDSISAQEVALRGEEAKRNAASGVVEAEASHSVELRAAQLKSERDALVLERKQQHDRRLLDFQVAAEQKIGESTAARKLHDADVASRAAELLHQPDEKHRAALAAIDKDVARSLAEADALRLAAIQSELVGALHAAADSEVMKAAANNMNLVALLGGKSPSELLGQILRGTPLDRSVRSMKSRAGEPGAAPGGDAKDDE